MVIEQDNDIEALRQAKIQQALEKSIEIGSNLPNGVVEIHSIEQFNEMVNTYKENLIIIDFWAEWCGPCKMFGPVFKELQHVYGSKGVVFLKINVDENQELAGQFNIDAIPTSLFIRHKKIIHQQMGFLQKAAFGQVIDRVLQKK